MTKGQLIEILNEFHDDDVVVVEVWEAMNEDLYSFHVDAIDCMGLGSGRTEIRICPTPIKEQEK